MHPSRRSALLLPALLAGCGLIEDRDSFRIISPFDATTPRDTARDTADARDGSDASDIVDASDATDASDASDADAMDADVRDASNDLGDASDLGAVDADVEAREDRAEPRDVGVRCMASVECPTDQYCMASGCTDTGVCVPRPGACIPTPINVCGCDGVTYSNACAAQMAGQRIASSGMCPMDGGAPDASEPCPTVFPALRTPWSTSVLTSQSFLYRVEALLPTRSLVARFCPLVGPCTMAMRSPLPDGMRGTISGMVRLSPGVYTWRIESARPECTGHGPEWTFRIPATTSDPGRVGTMSGLSADFNRDGSSELIVGAPADGSGVGAFYVIQFNDSGPSIQPVRVDTIAEPIRLFGSVLSAAGDLNGDGLADVVAGARLVEVGLNSGLVRMFFGTPMSLDPLNSIEAVRQPDYLVTGLAGLGDVDRDGLGDFLLASRNEGTMENTATLLRGRNTADGRATAPLSSIVDLGGLMMRTPPSFGASISAAGDADGDGNADFVVGAPAGPAMPDGGTPRGRAFLYFGGPPPYNAPRELFVAGMDLGSNTPSFGTAVANAGDFSGTGRPCVAVSAPARGPGESNFVHVFCATTDRMVRQFATANYMTPTLATSFGTVLVGIGDVNNDGFGDLAVGDRNVPGLVLVFGRGALPAITVAAFNPEAGGLGTGIAATGIGDVVNRDGIDDLAVGRVLGMATSLSDSVRVYPGITGSAFVSSLGMSTTVPAPTRTMGFGRVMATGR